MWIFKNARVMNTLALETSEMIYKEIDEIVSFGFYMRLNSLVV